MTSTTSLSTVPTNLSPSKESTFIITLSKMMEKMGQFNSPGNNDELLINIGKHLQEYWKVVSPSEPLTSNGSG